MEGKLFLVLFVAGTTAASGNMFEIGSIPISSGRLVYYGAVSEKPLSFDGVRDFCFKQGYKSIPTTDVSDYAPRKMLHERLPGVLEEQNLSNMDPSFWTTDEADNLSVPNRQCQIATWTETGIQTEFHSANEAKLNFVVCTKFHFK